MKQYWLKESPEDVAKRLIEFHGHWEVWGSNPIIQAWVRNTIAYYSVVLDANAWDTALSFEGEQGELVKMLVPQARSLARQFISLVTKQKLTFSCTALSTGADVAQETRLGTALSNQIVERQDLDRKGDQLAEQAYVMGASFIATTWRTDMGKPFAVGQDGALLYDGDLDMRVYSPFDVFYDYTIEDWDRQDWVEIRTIKNRWSLIAQFPELEREIMAVPKVRDHRGGGTSRYRLIAEDDLIYVYELYHRPTPALPQGRMLMYADDKTVFHDGPNVYESIPIEMCRPEVIMGMGFGYPQFSNLLPSQEMLDHSFSAIATNQAAHAVQNVACPRGAGISVQQINGMNFIQFTPQNVPGGGKPEPLQLTQSSPETFKFLETIRSHMLEISNVNSAIRGSPPPGVTSGAAIATLTTNAMEFLTNFSKAYLMCIEKSVMHGINAYRRFAKIPHIIALSGKSGMTTHREFVGGDLDPIQSVKVNQQNPAMMTVAGRADMADKLLQTGMVKTAQEYISILEGAPPQQLYQTELSENDLLQSENDALMEGQPVPTLNTDDHAKHMLYHASLLNDPRIRNDNNRVGGILSHIEEHYNLSKSQDPFFSAMIRTGKTPEGGPPPPQQQTTPGAPPGPPMAGPPDAGAPAGPAEPAQDMLGRA